MAIALGVLAACGTTPAPTTSPPTSAGPAAGEDRRPVGPGMQAPAFSLPRLDGRGRVQVPSAGKKVVLLSFWAFSWGGDRALPHLEEFHRRYAERGLELVVVSHDEASLDLAPVLRDVGITFAVARDPDGNVLRRYEPSHVMSVYVIDEDGRVRLAVSSGKGSSPVRNPEVEPLVRELLGLPPN